ncbi:hypothetical protein ACIQXV_11980 [Neobacillus sp. NPDC097160]|uniref:hypothetical protein n=1 Tax=Neobacillus sp. NPDC097160 TaxID=3364298 RepID=UPI003810DB41
MNLTLSGWMLYTMWAVFGLMSINLLISLFKSFGKGSFDTAFVLDYLKDILYYVLPLNILAAMAPMDPTNWTLVIFYYVGGIAVIVKYLMDIKNSFTK